MDERFFEKVTTQELIWRLNYAQNKISTWMGEDEGWRKAIECRNTIENELDRRINFNWNKENSNG